MSSESFTLILNNNNIVPGTYQNTYSYNFIGGSFRIKEKSKMCVGSITLPYSWFNLNKQYYDNVLFQYIFPTSSLPVTVTVTIPNGFYTIDDLNNYLAENLIANGYYLLDANGNNVQFITITTDSTYYANQLITYAVPTALPTGYTNPASMTFPAVATTPQVIISSSSNFGEIIGFIAGTYPVTAQATNYNVLGTVTPNATPVNNIIVHCNLVSNRVQIPSDVLDSFSINANFGSNINYEPSFEKLVSLRAGLYSNLIVYFTDQNNNLLNAQDSNVLITLIIKEFD